MSHSSKFCCLMKSICRRQSLNNYLKPVLERNEGDRAAVWGDKQPVAGRHKVNRPLGLRQPVLEVGKVMLPTMQYLLMAIYCIILSVQHKRRSMSVSVCQVGLRRTAPLKQPKQQRWQFIPKCARSSHTPRGQRYHAPVRGAACTVHLRVNKCECMCVFPCLCLYIPPC